MSTMFQCVASLACENYGVLECKSVNAWKHLNFKPYKSSVPTLQRTLYITIVNINLLMLLL